MPVTSHVATVHTIDILGMASIHGKILHLSWVICGWNVWFNSLTSHTPLLLTCLFLDSWCPTLPEVQVLCFLAAVWLFNGLCSLCAGLKLEKREPWAQVLPLYPDRCGLCVPVTAAPVLVCASSVLGQFLGSVTRLHFYQLARLLWLHGMRWSGLPLIDDE